MALPSQAIRKVAAELQELVTSPPEGIHVVVNEEDITDVTAYVRGPEDTPFEGGVFKIKLKLGADFPAAPPKGLFASKIFHPNVSAKGDICVNTLKKDWKPEMGIKHVLLTIKCLMINPNPESALNEEAGRLLIENYEDYFKHAQLMTNVHNKKTKWEELVPAPAPAATETNVATAEVEEAEKPKENAIPKTASKPLLAKPAPAKVALKQKNSLKRL